jgi:antitoxin MazE
MQAVVQRIGNSKGVRIPKRILDIVALKEHDIVEITPVDDGLFIKKAPFPSTLDELFKGYEGDYKCTEFDFSEDLGREQIW